MMESGAVRERRQRDRRASARTGGSDRSWFGVAGLPMEAESPGTDTNELSDSQFGSIWSDIDSSTERPVAADEQLPADARAALRALPASQAVERIYRAFLGARAALGLALMITLLAGSLFGLAQRGAVVWVSVMYAVLALTMWLLPRYSHIEDPHALARLRSPQWLATIGADIVCFFALHALSTGDAFNYMALLVLPAMMAGVLTPRLMALATAAAITLGLLARAWLAVLAGGEATPLLSQAGLAGSGLFLITVLAIEVSARLKREEMTARGSLEIARQQAQLNRLVIEEMQDGVRVVDRRGRVRAANPAARRLLVVQGLGVAAPFQLNDVDAWRPLVGTVERAFGDGVWPEAGRDVVLAFGGDVTRTLRVRVRFTRRTEARASEDLCVLLLEDVRSMHARMRQEKLAAMGRVSAGVAHEIRNPLAAISQANALLSEDASTASQRQLTRMVSDNVERLKRIVDDVMEFGPGQPQDPVVIDITAQVAALCSEWSLSSGVPLDEHSVLRVELPDESLGALFDPEHLRRVLINLLDNARRHASQRAGSVLLRLYARDDVSVVLSVASDGPPVPADVESYLFEPFFSTRSRGTGLGLYICRELCERHGASIDYRGLPASERHRNEFQVIARRHALTPANGRLHVF